MIIMRWKIICNDECKGCMYNERDAAYNPMCWLSESIDFIIKNNKNIKLE